MGTNDITGPRLPGPELGGRLARGLADGLARGLDWFLPPLCLGCRRTPRGGIDALNLCLDCRRGCRSPTGRRCPCCLVRLEDRSASSRFLCGSCRRRPPPYDRVLAGWAYEPPFDAVVVGLKFQRLEYLGDSIGGELVRRHRSDLDDVSTVVPVPLHWWRSLRRGYDQAERIAEGVARALDRPVLRALRRRLPTARQTGLDRAQRRRNLRGAFALREKAVRARRADRGHWLLVDDVFTTGATIESAARTLARAQPDRVSALVAAYTPHPRRPAPRR